MEKNGYVSDIHQKKPKGRQMSERTARANGRPSKTRAFVEHVFAQQKSRMGLIVRIHRHRAGQDEDPTNYPCMTAKAAQTATSETGNRHQSHRPTPKP